MNEDLTNSDKEIIKLKNQPAADEIKLIIKNVANSQANQITKLNLITTLLNYTIPETYTVLPLDVRKSIREIFQSLTGLGNLLSKIVIIKDNPKLDNEHLRLLRTLVSFLSEIFDSNLVLQLVRSHKKLVEIKEIDKLIFKGKCFSFINEIYTKNKIEIESKIFESSDNYVGYLNIAILSLFQEEVDIKTVNIFIHSLSSFNSNGLHHFFDLMFRKDHWAYFTSSFRNMKQFEKKQFSLRLLTFFITKRYLSGHVSKEKIVALGSILGFMKDLIDESFLDKIILSNNYHLNILTAYIFSDLPEPKFNMLTVKVLSSWAEENLIKSEPIIQQEYRTHLVILLLSYRQGTIFLKDLSKNQIFLDAISNRLNSFSNNVKTLGVILADKICEFNKEERIFQLDNIEGYSNLIDKEMFIKKEDYVKVFDDPWITLDEPIIVESESQRDLTTSLKRISITEKPYEKDSDDSDDDDDDDDPSITRRGRIAKPLYIKDLLEYITVDTKRPQAYEMRRLALNTGPSLIRQKFRFGNEVSFYSEDLLTHLVGLSNNYQEKDFEELKLNCMIAVLICNSASTLHLYKLLLTGDYSLQQRMSILSAASLAARELKGFKDDVVVASYTERPFPTKMLPSQLHRKYLELESGNQSTTVIDRIQSSIQDELMYEASEEAKNKIAGGKILRISNNLTRKSKPNVLVPKVNNFSKIIGTHFYFPLIGVWYESGGIDIGHYSPILIGHFIKTLTLLLHAAYPTTVNLYEMIKEFLSIVVPLTKKVRLDELQILESIITGVLLLCDITDEQYLVTNYHNELQMLQKWLTISWENIIDDRVKSLSAGLLLRLSSLIENFERVLMDQVNSFY